MAHITLTSMPTGQVWLRGPTNLMATFEFAAEENLKMKRASIAKANRERTDSDHLMIGDLVWKYVDAKHRRPKDFEAGARMSKKMLSSWTGPYRIVQQVGQNGWRLRHLFR